MKLPAIALASAFATLEHLRICPGSSRQIERHDPFRCIEMLGCQSSSHPKYGIPQGNFSGTGNTDAWSHSGPLLGAHDFP